MAKNHKYLTSNRLKRRIKYLCRRVGRIRYWEDVFNDYVVDILEGRAKNQLVEHWFIDYSRRQKWCVRKGKEHLLTQEHSFDEAHMKPVEAESPFLYEHVENLPGTKRALGMLHYKYNLKISEIADCFNVTESRMSQLFKKIREELRNAIFQ